MSILCVRQVAFFAIEHLLMQGPPTTEYTWRRTKAMYLALLKIKSFTPTYADACKVAVMFYMDYPHHADAVEDDEGYMSLDDIQIVPAEALKRLLMCDV